MRRALRLGLAAALGVVILVAGAAGYRIVRWKAYIWLPSYLGRQISGVPSAPDSERHVLFMIADHYEPGYGQKGAGYHADWEKAFRPVADRHHDSYGNKYHHTWFYPLDHHNDRVLFALSRLALAGYGEVEFHWHHRRQTPDEYTQRLTDGLAWFQSYGAMIGSGADRTAHFGYVAGNWALDDCAERWGGVSNELDILRQHGCYADFTYSTIGTACQPRKAAAIYYAQDTPAPKSYDDGIDVEVGRPVADRLMMITGPIGFVGRSLEYGALEFEHHPTPARVRMWIDQNISVKGRPEWTVVKLYTHSAQSFRSVLEDGDLDAALTQLETVCRERGIKLHYMTAREIYNVIKAAEAGLTGDPEQFRDRFIARPLNTVQEFSLPEILPENVAPPPGETLRESNP